MSNWKWRFWIIAWSKDRYGPTFMIDMGPKTWRCWRQVCGRLYWSNPTTNPTRHNGEYWSHPSLNWRRNL